MPLSHLTREAFGFISLGSFSSTTFPCSNINRLYSFNNEESDEGDGGREGNVASKANYLKSG